LFFLIEKLPSDCEVNQKPFTAQCSMPLMVSVGVACLSALLWLAESWQPIKATPAHVGRCRALWRDALAAGAACEVPFIAIPAPDLSDNTFTGPTLCVCYYSGFRGRGVDGN
jgi:hypothetical protein